MFCSQSKVAYSRPHDIVYDKKFDSALRDSAVAEFSKRHKEKRLTLDDKLIARSSYGLLGLDEWETGPEAFARIYRSILNVTRRRSKLNFSLPLLPCQGYMDVVKLNIRVQHHYLLSSVSGPLKDKLHRRFPDWIDQLEVPLFISNLLEVSKEFSVIIENMNKIVGLNRSLTDDQKLTQSLKMNFNKTMEKSLGLTLSWSQRLCCVTVDGKTYLAPKTYILMIHNKLCDIISILLLASFERHYEDGAAYEATLKMIEELASLIIIHKNKYFEISKVLESLVIGEILIKAEKWLNDSFLQQVVEELDAATNFRYDTSRLKQILVGEGPAIMNELGCLSKVMGHPMVDMEKGSKRIWEKANETYEVSLIRLRECECYMKESYIRTFLTNKKVWPPCTMDHIQAPKRLSLAMLKGIDWNHPSLAYLPPVPIDAFRHVTLHKQLHFNYLNNVIPYLKDKTISLMKSKVFSEFITRDPDVKSSWKETRLLLYYLLSKTTQLDHVAYIERYSNSTNLEDFMDYLMVKLVPKEKEHKVEFRGFGCKTYFDRLRCLSQETSVMQYLDEFSTEQAMTLDELSLIKKLETFRTLHKSFKDHLILTINLDSSAWCNHFRQETVDDLMVGTLDAIYGVPVFSKTQKSYTMSTFYVPDEAGTTWWEGQGGGIEGLNQDTWVVVYLAQIKTALSGLNVKYLVLCKGDDFRLSLIIPRSHIDDRKVMEFKNSIVERVSQAAKELGHKIKIADSYGSEVYFTFSKSASVGLIELPQTYRKIQKCYGSNNAFLPTLDDYVGASFSNAHSACRAGVTVYAPYCVALFWSIHYLQQHTMYRKLPDDEKTGLLLVPSILGGFPIIYLHNMFVRAESDLLSPCIGIYQYCKKYFPPVADAMSKFMYYKGGHVNYEQIYRDPYSIPITRPSLPSTVLRAKTADALDKLVANEDVIELIQASKSDMSGPAIEAMNSCNVLDAKIMNILYSSLPIGILGEILTKFETARSIRDVLILHAGHRKTAMILRQVIKAEKNLQDWRVARLKGIVHDLDISCLPLFTECPAESAQRLRDVSFKKQVVGITMPPIQHQIEIMHKSDENISPWARFNHMTISLTDKAQKLVEQNSDRYKIGEIKPFLGHKTKASVLSPQIFMVEHDVLLSKVKKLMDVVSWCDSMTYAEDGAQASNIRALIEKVITLYTDTPLEDLYPFAARRSRGTVQHHVRAGGFRESILPNTISNTYRSSKFTAGEHVTFMAGKNYRVNYLHVYCHCHSVLNLELETGDRMNITGDVLLVSKNCKFCMTPIVEVPIVINIDLVKRVRFDMLSLTKIAVNAERALQASLAGRERPYRVPIDENRLVDPVLACTVLVYNRYRHEEAYMNALKSIFGYHSFGTESRTLLRTSVRSNPENILKTEDLRNIPTEALCEVCIALVLTFAFPTFSDDSTQFLQWNQIPGSSLPWYHMVEDLVSTNSLPRVITRLAQDANYSVTLGYENPVLAASLLGVLCCKVWALLPRVIPIYRLSDCVGGYSKLFVQTSLLTEIYTRGLHRLQIATFKPVEDIAFLLYVSVLLTDLLRLGVYRCKDVDLNATHVTLNTLVTLDYNLIWELLDYTEAEFTQQRWPALALNLIDRSKLTLAEVQKGIREMFDEILTMAESLDAEPIRVHDLALLDCYSSFREYRTESGAIIATELEGIQRPPAPNTQFLTRPQPAVTSHIKRITSMEKIQKWTGSTNPFVASPDHLHGPAVGLFHCPFGYGNNSLGNMIYILTHFGMTHDVEGLYVAVLADGRGSTVQLMNRCLINSTILFTALSTQEKNPMFAVGLDRSRNTILDQHLSTGTDNLEYKMSVDAYKDLLSSTHVVFCDVEPQHVSMETAKNIYLNVLDYYFTTRVSSGSLILKLDTSYFSAIFSVIETLLVHCRHVYLVRPPSLSSHHYFYVVASGSRSLTWSRVMDIPYASTVSKIVNVWEFWKQSVFPDIRQDTILYQESSGSVPQHIITDGLTPYWIYKMEQGLKMIVDLQTLEAIQRLVDVRTLSYTTITEIMRMLQLQDNLDQAYKQIFDTEPALHVAIDIHTVRHYVEMIGRYMYYRGFTDYLENGLDRIKITDYQDLFANTLADPNLDQYVPDEFNTYDIVYSRDSDIPCKGSFPYWRQYSRGLECGMCFYAWARFVMHHSDSRDYHQFDQDMDDVD